MSTSLKKNTPMQPQCSLVRIPSNDRSPAQLRLCAYPFFAHVRGMCNRTCACASWKTASLYDFTEAHMRTCLTRNEVGSFFHARTRQENQVAALCLELLNQGPSSNGVLVTCVKPPTKLHCRLHSCCRRRRMDLRRLEGTGNLLYVHLG